MLGGMDRKLFGRWFTACKLERRGCVYAVVGREVARVELDMLTSDWRLRKEARAVVEKLFVELGDYASLKKGESPGDIGPRICLNRRVRLDGVEELCRGLVELAAKEVREQEAEAEEKASIKSKLSVPANEQGEGEKTTGGLYLPHKRSPGISSIPPWQGVPEPPPRSRVGG